MTGVGGAGFVADGDDVAGADLGGEVNAGEAAIAEDRGEVVSGKGAFGAQERGELRVLKGIGVGEECVGEAAAIGLACWCECRLRGIGKDHGGGAVPVKSVGRGGVADERPCIVQMRREREAIHADVEYQAEQEQHRGIVTGARERECEMCECGKVCRRSIYGTAFRTVWRSHRDVIGRGGACRGIRGWRGLDG